MHYWTILDDTIEKPLFGRASARSLKLESKNPLGEPMDSTMKEVYDSVIARDPEQPEFHQAVEEVLESLAPVIKACLLYTSPSPRDLSTSRMPSSA